MRSKTRLVVFVTLILVLISQGFSHPARATSFGAPLIVIMDNDIWIWTTPDIPLKNLTNTGGVDAASLSPDGKSVVYAEESQFVRDAFTAEPWPGLIPSDVWVLDLATGTTRLIVGQPPDISRKGGGVHPQIKRSYPVWSPDSKLVAWSEQLEYESEQIVIFDLTQNKIRYSHEVILYDSLTQMLWGKPGLAYQDKADDNLVFQVCDADGHVIASTPGPGTSASQQRWVKDGDHDYLYIESSFGTYEPKFFEPSTGKVVPSSDSLELYALSAPTGASAYSSQPTLSFSGSWLIAIPGKPPLNFNDVDGDSVKPGDLQYPYDAYTFAISPDGQSVAYERLTADGGHTVTIDYAGQQIETGIILSEAPYPSYVALIWSAVGWRVRYPRSVNH